MSRAIGSLEHPGRTEPSVAASVVSNSVTPSTIGVAVSQVSFGGSDGPQPGEQLTLRT